MANESLKNSSASSFLLNGDLQLMSFCKKRQHFALGANKMAFVQQHCDTGSFRMKIKNFSPYLFMSAAQSKGPHMQRSSPGVSLGRNFGARCSGRWRGASTSCAGGSERGAGGEHMARGTGAGAPRADFAPTSAHGQPCAHRCQGFLRVLTQFLPSKSALGAVWLRCLWLGSCSRKAGTG